MESRRSEPSGENGPLMGSPRRMGSLAALLTPVHPTEPCREIRSDFSASAYLPAATSHPLSAKFRPSGDMHATRSQ